MKNPKTVFYVLLGCLAVFQILKGCNENPSTTPYNVQTQAETSTVSQPVEVVPIPNWVYSSDVDKMRDETSYYAVNTSKNNVELDFPYQGGTHLKIMLRKDVEHGNDVIFVTNKGQLYCNYRDCYVSVKFDDGPVEKLEAAEAEAGSNEVLFLANNPASFAKKLKSANTVMVEVQFFDHGKEQFEFDVSGLEWSYF